MEKKDNSVPWHNTYNDTRKYIPHEDQTPHIFRVLSRITTQLSDWLQNTQIYKLNQKVNNSIARILTSPDYYKLDDETLIGEIKYHKIPIKNANGSIINQTGPDHIYLTKTIDNLIKDFELYVPGGDTSTLLVKNKIIALQQFLSLEGYEERSTYAWYYYSRYNKNIENTTLQGVLDELLVLIEQLDPRTDKYNETLSSIAFYLEHLEHFGTAIKYIYKDQHQAPYL